MKINRATKHLIEWEHNGKSYSLYADGYSLADEILAFAELKNLETGWVVDKSIGFDHYAEAVNLNADTIMECIDIVESFLEHIKYKWVAYSDSMSDSIYWTVIQQNGKYYLITNGICREITKFEYEELYQIKKAI